MACDPENRGMLDPLGLPSNGAGTILEWRLLWAAVDPDPGGLTAPPHLSGSTWVGGGLLRFLERSIENEVLDLGWQAGKGCLSHNNEEEQSSVFFSAADPKLSTLFTNVQEQCLYSATLAEMWPLQISLFLSPALSGFPGY